jgi:hypothetical protein
MTNQIETNHPAFRILKVASCPTASGKGTLTYHIGCNTNNSIQFRVVQNTGGGYFSAEWVAWELIQPALESAALPLTSFPLIKLYQGKSTNTPAFLMAVLKQEGLVRNLVGKIRGYEILECGAFITEMNALIAAGVNLKVAEIPANYKTSIAIKETAPSSIKVKKTSTAIKVPEASMAA